MEKFSKKIILISLLLSSCIASSDKKSRTCEKLLTNAIKIDSMGNLLSVFRRHSSLIVARYGTGEMVEQNNTISPDYVQFLCTRGENRVLKVKYNKENWILIDSLHTIESWEEYRYMFESVEYSVNSFIDLNLSIISRRAEDNETFYFLTRNGCEYFYSSDLDSMQVFKSDSMYIRISSNWWAHVGNSGDTSNTIGSAPELVIETK